MGEIRQELLAELERLSDEQIAALLQVARAMQPAASPESYDRSKDPAIGLISGPADLASRARDILRDEINPHSGWTRKDRL